MPSASSYLFLELSILAFALGIGWEYWNFKRLCSFRFLTAAFGLAVLWFFLDQIAVQLGLWTFPDGSTLPPRILSLPIEEYLLFFLHTVICFLFIGLCSREQLR